MEVLIFIIIIVIIITIVVKRTSTESRSSVPRSSFSNSMPTTKSIKKAQHFINNFYSSDPYLKLDHIFGSPSRKISKEYIKLLSVIKKESEWRDLGFKLKRNADGFCLPCKKNGLDFHFSAPIDFDEMELMSIKTGKKIVTDIYSLVDYIKNYGGLYEDFVYVAEDQKAYCEAIRFYENTHYEEALSAMKRAVELKPNEIEYNNWLFDIRLKLGDLLAIDEEIAFYANDIDSLIDARTNKWLKFLIAQKEYKKASEVIRKVNLLLDDLIAGKRSNQRYASNSKEYTKNVKEQFNKRLSKLAGFKSSKKIIENHTYSKDFLELCNLILSLEGIKNYVFIERIGDAMQHWSKKEFALNCYNLALKSLTNQNKPRVIERIQKKILSLKNIE